MRFFLFLLTIFYTLSLANADSSFIVSGKIKNGPANLTILIKKYNTIQNSHPVLEKLKIKQDGSFFGKMNQQPGIYQIDFVKYKKVNLAIESGQKIFLNIIFGSGNDPEIQIAGSRDAQLVYQYDMFREDSYKKLLAPIRKEMRLAKESDNTEIIPQLSGKEKENLATYQDNLANYAEENFGNSIALFYAAVRLNPERHLIFMTKIADWFSRNRPELDLTKQFNLRVERFKKLAIGLTAPDIKMKTATGKEVMLSSLKGKYVLLDFWASWCMPCRVENPNYARLYKKYKASGFEIFSISIDTNLRLWQQAAKRDKISWIDTSDLGGWQSESAKIYNVSSIPANFLLDKNGKIIAKNLRGKELEKKLRELFE